MVAVAPLRPSTLDSCFVNAGSGAERVVVGACVLVCAGVVCVLVVVLGCEAVVAVVVCETGGVSAAVTVFVLEPHAASAVAASAVAAIAQSAGESPRKLSIRRMSPWYSPLAAAFLALHAARPVRERLPRHGSPQSEKRGGEAAIYNDY
jgi:hypothetical protein